MVSKSSESSPPQAQELGDGLSLETIEIVRDVKCFLADGKMQVALFGSPSAYPDGWLVNLPWNQVFRSYPYEMPLDQSFSLQEAQTLAPFVEGLCNAPQTSEQTFPNQDQEVNLNLKDIVSSISESETIPAGQVRKVALAFFEKLGEALDNGERITAPGYVLNPRTIPAKEADGDKPARPEAKVATFRRRPVKQDNQEFKAWTGDD
ncbi:hypothetical protein N9996_02500 [Synechococcus sp. AH-603-M21]|nr:hypothetical protein [Synechococcus sp. AH-603-M21]